MADIRAFIFDLDGVITDTAEYHYLAWKRLADEEGLPFTRDDNEQLRGVSRRESLLRLLKGKPVPESTLLTWMERKNNYYVEFLESITPDDVLPGVVKFLNGTKSAGLKLGIGSASKNAKSVIAKLQLDHFFEVIGDGYSVVNSKPAQDLFVWVAGGMHLPSDQTVVFEDSQAGIDAAKVAGCYSVGIGTAGVSHADIVIPNLAEIAVDEIIHRLLARQ